MRDIPIMYFIKKTVKGHRHSYPAKCLRQAGAPYVSYPNSVLHKKKAVKSCKGPPVFIPGKVSSGGGSSL